MKCGNSNTFSAAEVECIYTHF